MPTLRRVRPMAEYSWPDAGSDTWSLLTRSATLDGGVGWDAAAYRPRHDYAVRRAFLRSYQFSVARESLRERVARSMRELNMEAVAVLRGIPRRLSPRRLGCTLARVLRPGVHVRLSSLSPVRCFIGVKACVVGEVG